MQFIITIVVGDAEDVFAVTQLLEPIAKIDALRMVSVVPRPQGMVHQPLAEGAVAGPLPGAPMGPGQSQPKTPGVQFSVAPQKTTEQPKTG